jgi:hypothetical protein
MRHVYRFTGLQRKGMALLLVVFVAFASLILLTTLLGSIAPRRASVLGEVQADRALALADGKIDLLMSTINTLPQVNVDGGTDANQIQAAIISGWEGMLNGYVSNPTGGANGTNVSTYFYHATSDTWYAVWDKTANHLMSIPAGTKLGREVSSAEETDTVLALGLKNLSNGNIDAGAITSIDGNCLTNNEWFEVDSNASYSLTPTDVWTIKASAYMLSKPGIVRTLEARAEKNVNIATTPHTTTTTTNVYNWFTTVTEYRSFSDYVFLDNFDVNFGKYAEVNGAVHANGTVNMGGWGKFPITSTEHVTAVAVDNGNALDGRFGPDKLVLDWAKANQDTNGDYYAEDHAALVDWLAIDESLFGKHQSGDAELIRNPLDPNGGMQDKAFEPYYRDRDATITFSVEDGVGKVTINGTMYNMPSNGIIYVQGNATIRGEVLGSCMVGTSGNISIAGDILYTTPPRTKETDRFTDSRDFLGLVAKGNVVIPYSTFVGDKNLEIDAAMVADGWLGTDPSVAWVWHDLNTDATTAPTLVLKGSMAAGSGEHMLATTQVVSRWVESGYWTTDRRGRRVWHDTSEYVDVPQIKGYDLRQYNFDWNLKQLGVPALFPVNNSGPMGAEEHGLTPAEAAALGLTNPQLHPKGNPLGAYYAKLTSSSTTVTGTTYSGTGLVDGGVYRIGWKEQIGEPVKLKAP